MKALEKIIVAELAQAGVVYKQEGHWIVNGLWLVNITPTIVELHSLRGIQGKNLQFHLSDPQLLPKLREAIINLEVEERVWIAKVLNV